MYITETHGCRAGKAAASAFKSASMHIPCMLQLLISQAKSYSKSSNLLMQKGQLFSLQFSSSMLKCKHVSPHSTLLFLHSSLVYQDQLIECQGIIYKGTGQDRTESWKRYIWALPDGSQLQIGCKPSATLGLNREYRTRSGPVASSDGWEALRGSSASQRPV